MLNKNLSILDIITLISFIIGIYALEIALQNLEENRIQTEDTKEVLYKLDEHLKKQDDYLHEQDKLLRKEK